MVGVLSRLPVVSSIGGHLSQRPASILPGAHHQLTTVLCPSAFHHLGTSFLGTWIPGFVPCRRFSQKNQLTSRMENEIRRPAFDSSCASLASSKSSSSASTGSSADQGSNRSELFWGQFDRIRTLPARKRSLWLIVKQLLLKKKHGKMNGDSDGDQIFTQSDIPTHPEGLYCVIDDFLETYTDGEGDFSTTSVEEDYAEIADTYDQVYEHAPHWDFNDKLFEGGSIKKTRVKVEDKDYSKIENCVKGHNLYNPYNSDNYYSLLYNSL